MEEGEGKCKKEKGEGENRDSSNLALVLQQLLGGKKGGVEREGRTKMKISPAHSHFSLLHIEPTIFSIGEEKEKAPRRKG